MRIPKRELPESIQVEVDRILGTSIHTVAANEDPIYQKARAAASKRYWEARGWTLLNWTLYPLGVAAAMVGLKAGLHVSPIWALIPGLAAAVPFHRLMPTTQGLTPEELRSYLPLLSLSSSEATYVEALVEAYAPNAEPSLREEVIPAMRRLLDESERLDRLESQLADGGSNSVQADLEAMRARLPALEDESARDALGLAIATAERRLASSISEGAARERIEAHRAMIRQSALAARETMRRLRLSPETAGAGTDLDLSALRASAEDAGREVAALEAAVQEMRAL